jgi:Na+/H+-dicarboxylate symporter
VYGVVIAIDWFIDRFRTALNVSSDLFAVGVITKLSGITDPEGEYVEPTPAEQHAMADAREPGVPHETSKV